MASATGHAPRYQLFRLLGEPQRLRLLGFAAIDELSVGELAELLQESQPNVSKHVHLLRQAGLLSDRHQGTRVYVRLSDAARNDLVVTDAVSEGQRLCEGTATRERVAEIIAARDQRSRAYFASPASSEFDIETTPHVPVYAMALALMAPLRGTALDAGTGDGGLLDLLAPSYEAVVAVDHSPAQLTRASERVTRRGFSKVRFQCADAQGRDLLNTASKSVDAVFASRMLHHTPSPRTTLEAFASLLVPGGRLCVIDYVAHDDERMREQRADVWMGFDEVELRTLLQHAGFEQINFKLVPRGYVSPGFDAHIPWFIAIAQRP